MDKALEDLAFSKVSLVSSLLGAGKSDTVYRDIYFARARPIVAEFLPHAEYLRQQCSKTELDDLLRAVAPALDRREWAKVKELSSRMRLLQDTVDEKRTFSEVAKEIYEPIDLPVNPFDLRLLPVGAFMRQEPAKLRSRLVATLIDLENADPSWREFYADRRGFFEALTLSRKIDNETKTVDAALIQKRAKSALEKRDVRSLERLAEEMLKLKAPVKDQPVWRDAGARSPVVGKGPYITFSDETLRAASRLGLASAQTEPSPEFGEYLQCCCAWHANISDRPLTESGKCFTGCTCGHPCPPTISPPLKDTLDLLMLQPFINSAGVRYLPRFDSEWVLVEDFPEDEKYNSGSALLLALGLQRRTSLSRLQIDQALLLRGPEIIEKDLGLNPREYRIVCIPFDLYARFAPRYEWGQKKLWTHFDGFQIWKGARLRALVGGDVQFGGRYDLCSISRADENDRVIVRFAVVGRQRLDFDR